MTPDQIKTLLDAQRQLMKEYDEVLAPAIRLLDEDGYKHFINSRDPGKVDSFPEEDS